MSDLRGKLKEGLEACGYCPSDRDLGTVLKHIQPEVEKISEAAVVTAISASAHVPVAPEPAPEPEPVAAPVKVSKPSSKKEVASSEPPAVAPPSAE